MNKINIIGSIVASEFKLKRQPSIIVIIEPSYISVLATYYAILYKHIDV